MVKFLTSGRIKITQGKYLVEIDENLLTKIYRSGAIGKPAILINHFQTETSTIDCMFTAFEMVYEHKQRSNTTL